MNFNGERAASESGRRDPTGRDWRTQVRNDRGRFGAHVSEPTPRAMQREATPRLLVPRISPVDTRESEPSLSPQSAPPRPVVPPLAPLPAPFATPATAPHGDDMQAAMQVAMQAELDEMRALMRRERDERQAEARDSREVFARMQAHLESQQAVVEAQYATIERLESNGPAINTSFDLSPESVSRRKVDALQADTALKVSSALKVDGPKSYLGNKSVPAPSCEGADLDAALKKRLRCQVRYFKNLEDYMAARHDDGEALFSHVRQEAKRVAQLHLEASNFPSRQAQITHLDMHLEPHAWHKYTLQYLKQEFLFLKPELPEWLQDLWDSAVKRGKLKAQEAGVDHTALHSFAALVFALQVSLGPKDRTEHHALLKRVQQPLLLLHGRAGSDWPTILEECLEDAKCLENDGINWSFVAQGYEAVSTEVKVFLDSKAEFSLNTIERESGISSWDPSYELVYGFNVDLCHLLRNSKDVRSLSASWNKQKAQAHFSLGGKHGKPGGKGKYGKPGKQDDGAPERKCTHCNKDGHLVEQCWKRMREEKGKHGKPGNGDAPAGGAGKGR
jgi:hypothetical protein